jgi:hypothetical protein
MLYALSFSVYNSQQFWINFHDMLLKAASFSLVPGRKEAQICLSTGILKLWNLLEMHFSESCPQRI